jgi:hypothetical protein
VKGLFHLAQTNVGLPEHQTNRRLKLAVAQTARFHLQHRLQAIYDCLGRAAASLQIVIDFTTQLPVKMLRLEILQAIKNEGEVAEGAHYSAVALRTGGDFTRDRSACDESIQGTDFEGVAAVQSDESCTSKDSYSRTSSIQASTNGAKIGTDLTADA